MELLISEAVLISSHYMFSWGNTKNMNNFWLNKNCISTGMIWELGDFDKGVRTFFCTCIVLDKVFIQIFFLTYEYPQYKFSWRHKGTSNG